MQKARLNFSGIVQSVADPEILEGGENFRRGVNNTENVPDFWKRRVASTKNVREN